MSSLPSESPLAHFVTKETIGDNIYMFDKLCRAIRIQSPKPAEAPAELKVQVSALLAFHSAAVRAVGIDSDEFRAGTTDERKLWDLPPLDDERDVAELKRLGFKAGKIPEGRPSFRQTGQIAPIGHLLRRRNLPPPEGPIPKFRPYSAKSAW